MLSGFFSNAILGDLVEVPALVRQEICGIYVIAVRFLDCSYAKFPCVAFIKRAQASGRQLCLPLPVTQLLDCALGRLSKA